MNACLWEWSYQTDVMQWAICQRRTGRIERADCAGVVARGPYVGLQ